jgi:hypothetical protein
MTRAHVGSIVVKNPQVAEVIVRGCDHLADAVLVIQIHADRDRTTGSLLDLAGNPLGAFSIDIRDHNSSTLARKALGSRLANARCGAGHHGRPAIQSVQLSLLI